MLYKTSDFSVFKKRNLERNVLIKIQGLHNLLPSKLPMFLQKILREILYIKEYINVFCFNQVSIPQIEFILTTKCTLKCKKCAGYFPTISAKEHMFLSFDEFKIQFDNLTNSVDKIQNLILTGGEPLLSKDLVNICEYSLSNKKVKKVWIFTNGTIEISDDLFFLLKKFKSKIIVRLSNYSNNSNLTSKLKHKQILSKLNESGVKYIYSDEDKWIEVFDIQNYKRTKEENRKYFRNCLHNCLAVFMGILYVCPRGAVISLKEKISKQELISVDLNEKISKRDIINFYNSDYFPYCNYCNFIKERNCPQIPPAEQL